MLASVSAAKVLGFNVGASRQTRDEAEKLNIEIKEYSIVYDVLDDVRAMMAALIRPPPSKRPPCPTTTRNLAPTALLWAGLVQREGGEPLGLSPVAEPRNGQPTQKATVAQAPRMVPLLGQLVTCRLMSFTLMASLRQDMF